MGRKTDITETMRAFNDMQGILQKPQRKIPKQQTMDRKDTVRETDGKKDGAFDGLLPFIVLLVSGILVFRLL